MERIRNRRRNVHFGICYLFFLRVKNMRGRAKPLAAATDANSFISPSARKKQGAYAQKQNVAETATSMAKRLRRVHLILSHNEKTTENNVPVAKIVANMAKEFII